MSAEIVDRSELKRRIEEFLSKDSSYISYDGINPNHITLGGVERYIYVKNLSPAQLSNDNPNITRVQLPIRQLFDDIKNSPVSFVLIGYDAQNDVCAVWNPHEVKQRLNVGKSVSFYSRLSIQEQARKENIQIRKHLNQGVVLVFPREDLLSVLLSIDALFPDDSPYVAMGSRLRISANSAYKRLCDKSNLPAFRDYLISIGLDEAEIENATDVIRRLITTGVFASNRRLFLSCDTVADYYSVLPDFIKATEEFSHQYIWEHNYGQSVFHYIDFLNKIEPESPSDMPESDSTNVERTESPVVDSPDDEDDTDETVPEEEDKIDWETPFEDKDGILTRIANPELIELLRPVLTGEFKSTNTAMNIFADFYGPRYKHMRGEVLIGLLRAIDWSHPFISPEELNGAPRKKTKAVILQVTFPDGRIIKHRRASLTYIETIQALGPKDVHDINIRHAGVNIVADHPDEKYKDCQHKIMGGWYIMTNTSTPQKMADLKTIAEQLEEDIKIELVPIEKVPHRSKNSSKGRQKIRLVFPDGRTIQPNKVADAIFEVVKFAGMERVFDLNIDVGGMNMILPEPHPKYPADCHPLGDGWYVNTGGDTVRRYQIIKQISDSLQLGIDATLV